MAMLAFLVLQAEARREGRPRQIFSPEFAPVGSSIRGFTPLPQASSKFVPLRQRGATAWGVPRGKPLEDMDRSVNELLVHEVTDGTDRTYARWIHELLKQQPWRALRS